MKDGNRAPASVSVEIGSGVISVVEPGDKQTKIRIAIAPVPGIFQQIRDEHLETQSF